MSDPRNILQGLFVPERRFANFGDALIRIHALGFRCHQSTVVEVQSPITAFCGLNGTGKAKNVVLKSTEPIKPETRTIISGILGNAYDAADENSVGLRGSFSKVVTVGRDGCTYSEINMGCGEGRIHHIIRVLEGLPDKGLVLLEEPETSLHPSAQHQFGKYLVDVCTRKRHQVFLTTHSEYLLRALPERSRLFLVRTPSGIKQIPGVSVDQAASLMADQYRQSLHILVEDDVAQAVVAELLRVHDPYFSKTVKISIGGDKQQIQKFMEVLTEMSLPACAVRDGDVGAAVKEKLFKLPGSLPSEKEIFNSVPFQQMIKEKFDIHFPDLLLKLGGKNRHEWFAELARLIPFDYNALLQISAGEYLKSVMETERQTLVSLIKSAVKS